MKKIFQYILMTVAMVAMASCSQDEVLTPSAEVQNIRIVVSEFPAFDDAQTRAIGTFDSGKTAWEPGDVIYIIAANAGVDSQILTLTFGDDGNWAADGTTIHYLSASDTHIRAIYAPNCETEGTEITAKDNLPYGTGEFLEKDCYVENGTLTVDFTEYVRSYSRLRIVTEPNEQITVTARLFDPAGYYDSGTYDYTLTADANGNAYLYGTFAANGTVKVVGDVTVEHTFTEATAAENSYVLFARRGANLAKLTSTYVINDSETHYFYGSGNLGIKVASGSPTIILSDANISLNVGDAFSSAVNAIDIVATNSTTTIRVEGTENNITAKYGAGIFVAQGSTVTIVGRSRDDKLTVLAGGDAAAIGGYTTSIPFQYLNCGAINISNITVEAYGGCDESCSPGIGNVGTASGETITIDNAVVHAFGTLLGSTQSTPGIGCGYPISGSPGSIPTIVIKNNSIIHSYRGSGLADYIGWAGDGESTAANSAINCGIGGSIISSTVYCYTGVGATSPDKIVTYDANGTATEQTAE